MQHRSHVEIGIANFLMEDLGILRAQHVKHTVRDIGRTILRSGNLNRCRGNFSANYLGKMICKKARLCAVTTTQIKQRKLWVCIALKEPQILLSGMNGIGIPKYFTRSSAQRAPIILPRCQIPIRRCHSLLLMVDR